MRKILVVCVATVAGLAMSVAGSVAVSDTEYDVFKTSDFSIKADYNIAAGGDYIFTGDHETNVMDPEFADWAKTDTVSITFSTNTGDHGVTFAMSPYTNSERNAVLPTEFIVGGTVVENTHVEQPELGTTTFSTHLQVKRNGWNDPAGTYQATVTITVVAL